MITACPNVVSYANFKCVWCMCRETGTKEQLRTSSQVGNLVWTVSEWREEESNCHNLKPWSDGIIELKTFFMELDHHMYCIKVTGIITGIQVYVHVHV